MTKGIHHLGISVREIEEAKHFFVTILGWSIVREDSDYPSLFVSDGTVLLTIWKTSVDEPVAFNRKNNIGLHHFALLVGSENELVQVYQKIKTSKFSVEFPPEPFRKGPATHFICCGPSGIRIEFINKH